MRSSLRIVLTNIGTYGDIHPLIALALELKHRGHSPVLAAPNIYRVKVESLGLEFHAIRPDIDATDNVLVEMIYDIRKGTERGLREFLFPVLKESYKDLLAAVKAGPGADLILVGELAYAGPIVAEITGIPWASYVLAPISFFSASDPPVLPPYPKLATAEAVLPGMGQMVARFVRWTTRKWSEPVYQLRAELGLDSGGNPLFDAKHSPQLVLAMFSPLLGQPQPDWPSSTLQTGFVFYDGDTGNHDLSPHLEEFLQAGEPPVVFTLGSAAVLAAGNFYHQSALAARSLGLRAVLLVGSDPRNIPDCGDSKDLCIANYAPYSKLFPRASLIVHQGGVGTTAQALRAGKPMIIMPYSHDQPDNARRLRRLGVSRTIRRKNYTAERAARSIRRILDDPQYQERALELSHQICGEESLKMACDALEKAAKK
jgi:rhamnosyltransferase subunit B